MCKLSRRLRICADQIVVVPNTDTKYRFSYNHIDEIFQFNNENDVILYNVYHININMHNIIFP